MTTFKTSKKVPVGEETLERLNFRAQKRKVSSTYATDWSGCTCQFKDIKKSNTASRSAPLTQKQLGQAIHILPDAEVTLHSTLDPAERLHSVGFGSPEMGETHLSWVGENHPRGGTSQPKEGLNQKRGPKPAPSLHFLVKGGDVGGDVFNSNESRRREYHWFPEMNFRTPIDA